MDLKSRISLCRVIAKSGITRTRAAKTAIVAIGTKELHSRPKRDNSVTAMMSLEVLSAVSWIKDVRNARRDS